jgi:hypothetical protein
VQETQEHKKCGDLHNPHSFGESRSSRDAAKSRKIHTFDFSLG